mgnify:FL=1
MNIDNAKYLDKIEKIQKRYPYQQMPEHLKQALEQDIRIRLSWNTNSLEGNTLSLEETVEIISYDEVRSGHTYSEYTEAKNSYKAYQKMNFSQVQEIDLNLIRQINGIIMDSDGNFRTNQVYIGSLAEVAFLPPEPEKIEERMENYLSSMQMSEPTEKLQKIIQQIAKLHMEFEMIHPFRDGNGRTGRFMMNQMLLNQGILPAIILNHSKYRQAFRIYERNGGTGLMEYCLVSGIARSYEILEDNCVKLGIFPVFR